MYRVLAHACYNLANPTQCISTVNNIIILFQISAAGCAIMADKPGLLKEEEGQVIVTIEEEAEGNKKEVVEGKCGEESDSENIVVKSNSALKDYATNLYQQAGGLVEEQEDEISLVRHSSLLSDKSPSL